MSCKCIKEHPYKIIILTCKACPYYFLDIMQGVEGSSPVPFDRCRIAKGRTIEGLCRDDGGCPQQNWPKITT